MQIVESWNPILMLQEDGLEATSPASPAEETWGVCELLNEKTVLLMWELRKKANTNMGLYLTRIEVYRGTIVV